MQGQKKQKNMGKEGQLNHEVLYKKSTTTTRETTLYVVREKGRQKRTIWKIR